MVCCRFVLPMWERLRRFRRLSSRARAQFLRAVFLLPVISLSLRVRGFGATQKWLRRFLPRDFPLKSDAEEVGPAGKEEASGEAATADWAVDTAARYGVAHPTCLQRSLALWYLLGRVGVRSELRIGVRKTGEKFEAHAWVECDGAAVGELEALHEHYAVLDAELSGLPVEKAP